MVELLLGNGAAVNQATKDGFTPLYIACQKGHKNIVELLLGNGARVKSRLGCSRSEPIGFSRSGNFVADGRLRSEPVGFSRPEIVLHPVERSRSGGFNLACPTAGD